MTLNVTDVECAAGASTGCSLAVGDTEHEEISQNADADWFSVDLTAGVVYKIEARGGSGAGDLSDPSVEVRSASGAVVAAETSDTDGDGVAEVFYGPDTSGTYYVVIADADDVGTGDYIAAVSTFGVSPRFTSAARVSVDENTELFRFSHELKATDRDSRDSITGFEVTGGPDQSSFEIVAWPSSRWFLEFSSAMTGLDYESKASYTVEVTVTSGTGNRQATAVQTITVSVRDVVELKPPTPELARQDAGDDWVRYDWTVVPDGSPTVTQAIVQWRLAEQADYPAGNELTFLAGDSTGTDGVVELADLDLRTDYVVRVAVENGVLRSEWSAEQAFSTKDGCTTSADTTRCIATVGEIFRWTQSGRYGTYDYVAVDLEAGRKYLMHANGCTRNADYYNPATVLIQLVDPSGELIHDARDLHRGHPARILVERHRDRNAVRARGDRPVLPRRIAQPASRMAEACACGRSTGSRLQHLRGRRRSLGGFPHPRPRGGQQHRHRRHRRLLRLGRIPDLAGAGRRIPDRDARQLQHRARRHESGSDVLAPLGQ